MRAPGFGVHASRSFSGGMRPTPWPEVPAAYTTWVEQGARRVGVSGPVESEPDLASRVRCAGRAGVGCHERATVGLGEGEVSGIVSGEIVS